MATELRREHVEAAVKNFTKSSDFILKDFKVKPMGDKTVGFMGQHVQLTAYVCVGGKDQEIRFFAKLAPKSVHHRSFVINYNMFTKELTMYNTFVPKLQTFLPPDVKFPVPKCYLGRGRIDSKSASESETEELVILEDLRVREYITVEIGPYLDLPHCRLVMKTMAKFHASSILLERSYRASHPNQDPAEGLFSPFKENFLVNEEGHLGSMYAHSSAESMATAMCKIWPERYEGKRQEVLAVLLKAWDKVFEMVKPSKHYPNVLCHGDLWANNMAFSYGPDRRTPVDNVYVDLQLCRYAPPVIDMLLFFHVSTKRAFREQHLRELLSVYYEDLRKYVSSDFLEKYLPLQSLIDMYDKYIDFGRVLSTGYIPCILGETDTVVTAQNKSGGPIDVNAALLSDKGEAIAVNCGLSKFYKDGITETYQECLEGLGLWK